MSAFTPGPWTVDIGDEYGWYRINEAATEQMAEWDEDETDELPADHDMGNARLIAAAPDLLAALEAFVSSEDARDDGHSESSGIDEYDQRYYCGVCSTCGGDDTVCPYLMARTAIAKAKGAEGILE